ncbi:OLC1v1006710C1 [Oldenlandia corymbosa var. corymbosa]|uniref:GTP cyclohydrolase 1 n=1 Tax=Oldenlandia corymbosa var. corymbosa TaxID=529605 RepID=A0AAV1DKP9_OLDCO|nr:OLC1v1006710C1 [Oldenlandia corymbosa var. corymbosa]
MGALDEGHFNEELENGVCLGDCVELGSEGEPEYPAIEDAVRVLLQGLGEDINREGIRKTPHRVAKALREGTRGYREKAKDIVHGALFPEVGGTGELVIVRDLDLFSYCESCLLPFQVKCHVGYVPSGKRILGLSKFSRVADVFAKRLQDPQRLANELCKALQHSMKPAGVAVILQCSHIGYPNIESAIPDSNHQGWIKLLVSSGSGVFEDEKADIWADFLSLLKFRGVTDRPLNGIVEQQSWCPSHSLTKTPTNSAMTEAVSSILQSLGEDPSRKELVGTPARFVTWLMNFRISSLEMKLSGIIQNQRDCLNLNGDVKLSERHLSLELNVPFWSQCEHHLLPFHGVVHIGYYSAEGVIPVGRSLLQTIIHFYGFKLQVQERLTKQIAETVSTILGEDVMVVVEANHSCMISRGIEKFGSNTATTAALGRFSTDPSVRAKFLQSIPDFLQSAP